MLHPGLLAYLCQERDVRNERLQVLVLTELKPRSTARAAQMPISDLGSFDADRGLEALHAAATVYQAARGTERSCGVTKYCSSK